MNGPIICHGCEFEIRPDPRTKQVMFSYVPVPGGSAVPAHFRCIEKAKAKYGVKDDAHAVVAGDNNGSD